MNKEEALALLEGLGETSRQVADTLFRKNITGYRRSSRSCPISRFLQHHGARVPSTCDCQIIFGDLLPAGELVSLHPPIHIHAFINDFDAGNYPELEEK
jgi:hypothetical protein